MIVNELRNLVNGLHQAYDETPVVIQYMETEMRTWIVGPVGRVGLAHPGRGWDIDDPRAPLVFCLTEKEYEKDED